MPFCLFGAAKFDKILIAGSNKTQLLLFREQHSLHRWLDFLANSRDLRSASTLSGKSTMINCGQSRSRALDFEILRLG